MPGLIDESVAIFLTIMVVVLVTPLLSERVRLPGIVGMILGGILIGPHGFHLLSVDNRIELLATIGLIYLMFNAGLEVDLRQFNRVRQKSLVFGLFTYLLPQLIGMFFGRWLGLDWLGAILLGSAFSSHTLISFPILTRLGIVKNEAVSITVGATVFTDIVAFIVLAVVVAAQGGTLEPGYFVQLSVLLAAYAGLILFGLPRIGKAFFRRFHGPTVEFQFVLVVLFIAAVLAEQIGVHAVVGAFLAGLAINATLPHQSPVVCHVLFLGESFFIPVFLVYSGMITDAAVFLSGWQTLLIGAGVTFVAYASKLIAAWMAARIFHYSRDEFMTVWGLSQAQAAVTIPTLVIGLEIGLFSETLFNAVIVMILFTSITSPMFVQRYGCRLHADEAERKDFPLFKRILVPIANPETQEHLITLANVLARTQEGELFALHVAQESQGQAIDLSHQRQLLDRVPELLNDPKMKLNLIPRIDHSVSRGILHAALEYEVTLIVLGWRGKPTFRQSVLGSLLDEVVWKARVPVLVGRLKSPVNAFRRVVMVVPKGNGETDLKTNTLKILTTMANSLNIPLLILSGEEKSRDYWVGLVKSHFECPCEFQYIQDDFVRKVSSKVHQEDLVVINTTGKRGHFRSSLGHMPESLAAATSGSIVVIHYPQ
jgi:Kef-type K+ transport system membrane component KefB